LGKYKSWKSSSWIKSWFWYRIYQYVGYTNLQVLSEIGWYWGSSTNIVKLLWTNSVIDCCSAWGKLSYNIWKRTSVRTMGNRIYVGWWHGNQESTYGLCRIIRCLRWWYWNTFRLRISINVSLLVYSSIWSCNGIRASTKKHIQFFTIISSRYSKSFDFRLDRWNSIFR